MRGRTPAGREYATHAAGAGGRLPEGVSMAIETIWKRSGLAFESCQIHFRKPTLHGACGWMESRNPAASPDVAKLMAGDRI